MSGADPTGKTPGPRISLKAGSRVVIGRLGDPGARLMTFKRRIGPRDASRLEFTYDEGEQYTALSDEQIAFLCQQGEFNIVFSVGGEDRPAPPSPLQLTDDQTAYAERCKAYVDACHALEDKFRRSQLVLEPVIAALAKARNEEKAPGVTTVLTWIDLWNAGGEQYGISVFIRLRRTSNGHRDVGDARHQAMAHGVHLALKEGTAEEALRHAQNWLAEHHPDLGHEKKDMPSVRTFQRRMASIDKRISDEAKFGPRRARRKNEIHYETKKPLLPLEEVEVDNTPLDIICVDETGEIVFGRPNLLSFRDRATGSVLGLSLGWEAPSYASFMDGLRHATYPKKPEETPAAKTDWYCWGRVRRLYVDNALEFLSDNIHHASSRLQFQLAEFKPGNPWLKGAQERLFRTLNMQVHKLPGATFSNILARRDRAELEKLPILTRRELWDYLSVYVCDIYHRDGHEGLGLLRTMKDVPCRLWAEAVAKVSIAPLPSEDQFIALAGDTALKSVTQKGIRWDNIRYGSADLEALRTNPNHRDGRTDGDWAGRKHEGSKYEVKRDPFDLSHVWVINPYDRHARPINVPAMRQDYATDLTLHQHRVIIANANKKLLQTPKDGEDPEDELIRAKRRLAAAIVMLQEVRKAQDIERKLARYLYEGRRKQDRSIVTTRPIDPQASRLPLDPSKKTHTATRGGRAADGGPATPSDQAGTGAPPADRETGSIPAVAAPNTARPRTPIGRRPSAEPDDDFDIEAMQRRMAQNEKWKSV